MERLVAKILAQPVPFAESRSMVRYSLGCGDFQAIQAPRSSEIPVTDSSIAKLLTWIGPTNLMNVILLLLTDNKVAVFGRSFSALYDASRALTSLIYPFKYSFPHIPVLPPEFKKIDQHFTFYPKFLTIILIFDQKFDFSKKLIFWPKIFPKSWFFDQKVDFLTKNFIFGIYFRNSVFRQIFFKLRLPHSMLDMLMSPVPFLVGIHSDRWAERLGENPDVIGCDLDGSKLLLPDHIQTEF